MRAARPTRRTRQGQTLVIFAVFAALLFGVLGLAIDAGRAYTIAARQLQAAKAAALAGAPYMPNLVNATNAAKIEAARNGYRDGDTTNGRNVVVTATQPGGATNQLQVSVADKAGVTFMAMFGFTAYNVVRSATAYYLPPLGLGQPNSQLGSDSTNLGTAGHYYIMESEGWSRPRQYGDAFSPTPNDVTTQCDQTGAASCRATPLDEHLIAADRGTDLSSVTAITGWSAASTPTTALNIPSRGGYNYLVFVPATQSIDIQVFNPSNAPDAYTGAASDYEEFLPRLINGAALNSKTDYSAMAYTVFQVNNVFSRITDTAVTSQTYLPYDAGGGPCAPTGKYCWFPPPLGTLTGPINGVPFDYHQWIDVLHKAAVGLGAATLVPATNQHTVAAASHLSGGATGAYYRLRVDNLNWDGSLPNYAVDTGGSVAFKGYAVRAVNAGTNTICAACDVSAMNDMCFYTPISTGAPNASFPVPLMNVPAEYRGQTLAVYAFDPGDVLSGDVNIQIQFPTYHKLGAAPAVTVPSALADEVALNDRGTSLASGASVAMAPATAGKASVNTTTGGVSKYNGVWIEFQVTVPTDYDPPAGTASYWNLVYSVTGQAIDVITVQVSLTGGSPVHLLP